MISFDRALLAEVGLGELPADRAGAMLDYLELTCQIHVGERIAARLTNEQLDEFEPIFEADDEEAAQAWLEQALPDYRSIVENEFEVLKNDWIEKGPQGLLDDLRRFLLRDYERRVLSRIADELTPAQQEAFAELCAAGSQRELLAWLDREVPHHRSIAASELEVLRAETRERWGDLRHADAV